MDKTHFLLIDDDLDDQEIFCMALGQVSPAIPCTTARDGLEGLALLQNDASFRPGFIFIDLNMPRLNGMECLKQIREKNLAPQAKIVMYSTTIDESNITHARSLGADDFLIKPTSVDDLENELRKRITLI